jgi:uncharacterized hydrophobic protein (TIGR00271 family)
MLISPLMQPILGIGYGAGVNDFGLIRSAARSLLIFAVLSVLTSALYFMASPLSQAQSELLARTTPTLWDVLIAFFGGCAGIVAQTRREESNVLPGAAIATALMPPLCTVGYGLATQNWSYVGGALYLFAINAFFIALSTYVFVKLLAFPSIENANPALQKRAHVAIVIGVFALVLPSAYLAYGLVRDQVFITSSKQVLHTLETQPGAIMLTKDVDVRERRIAVTLGGTPLAPTLQAQLNAQLRRDGFPAAQLVLRTIGDEKIDLTMLREQLRREFKTGTLVKMEERDTKLDELNLQLAKLNESKKSSTQIIRELLAEYPSIKHISVGEVAKVTRTDPNPAQVLMVVVESEPVLAGTDLERIKAGLAVRLPDTIVELVQQAGTPPKQTAVARKRTSRHDSKAVL